VDPHPHAPLLLAMTARAAGTSSGTSTSA
jgi:hypothetical protein